MVTYFSRAFNKHERRYCVTRRELLAVVLSIRHFKYYQCGMSFTVRTNYSVLQWLLSFKEREGQVAMWLEELQAYNFSVEHRAGTRHTSHLMPCHAARVQPLGPCTVRKRRQDRKSGV